MTEKEKIEELLQGLEGTANFLRGAIFDPSIPRPVKEALASKMHDIEILVSKHLED